MVPRHATACTDRAAGRASARRRSYESTIQALESLYDKLSAGGYVIVDDYGNMAACRQAVHDFRERRGITDPIRPIDWAGVYWRRSDSDRKDHGSESG